LPGGGGGRWRGGLAGGDLGGEAGETFAELLELLEERADQAGEQPTEKALCGDRIAEHPDQDGEAFGRGGVGGVHGAYVARTMANVKRNNLKRHF
jgi:hypothetical protein